jgi:hypothetical protein
MERKKLVVRLLLACLAVAVAVAASAQGPVTLHDWNAEGNANDLLGGAPGTLLNGVTFTAGHPGQAFSFNESGITGAAVSFGSAPLNVGTDNFMLDFRMRTAQPWTDTNRAVAEVLSKREVCNHGSFFDIRILGPGNLAVEFDDGAGNYFFLVSTAPVTDGAWHRIGVVRKGTSNQLHIDGKLDVEVTSPLSVPVNIQNGADLLLGWGPCVYADGTQPFVGALDDVRLMSGFGQ